MCHLSQSCHHHCISSCMSNPHYTEMSVDLKQCTIDWYLVDQYTCCQIAVLADCSIGYVSSIMENFQEFGQVENPFSSCTGCPSQIQKGDMVYLHALLEANMTLYLDELQTCLLFVWNINLLIATISWILAQYELSVVVFSFAGPHVLNPWTTCLRLMLTKNWWSEIGKGMLDFELGKNWLGLTTWINCDCVVRPWRQCHRWQAEWVYISAIFGKLGAVERVSECPSHKTQAYLQQDDWQEKHC